MKKLFAGCALAALATSSAYAQSTASQQLDQQTIVVTGTKVTNVEGVQAPDTPKTREVLTAEFIQHQTPGQAISDTINMIPGVSFQNNDSYGSGGGFLTIRGFDQSRISKTFDGIPLNDTGNYALYSNQDLDPELIQQVSVSLGSTDIDSPTAAATGSTVNYITMNPTEDAHVRLQGSYGSFDMTRIFGKIDTGTFTKYGTRLWVAASKQDYHTPFDDNGRIDKQQYNIKIYQPINSNGDFVSIGGHFNKNNNNFFGSSPLRNDTTILSGTGAVIGTRVAGIDSSTNRYPANADERTYYNNQLYYGFACQQPTPNSAVAENGSTSFSAGAAPNSAACGALFDARHNPSKTGNIRVNSRFTLTPKLILTVDPFYEYTDANGGGLLRASEGTAPGGFLGYVGGTVYAGHDLNGDGSNGTAAAPNDTVLLLAPSNTVTNRYGVIGNLLYNFTPTQTVRLNYTFDYGHHVQTGEMSAISINGQPSNLFPHDGGAITDSAGVILQKRNRFSLAILNQVAGQYRGKFLEDKLTIDLGVRVPFFQRKLHNYCFTTAGNGNVDCVEPSQVAAYAAAHPYSINPATGLPATGSYAPPQNRNYKFHKALPVAGLTYQVAPRFSVYGSYSEGISVPGTDQLYNSFYYPQGFQNPKPETSYNFDLGVRMRSSKVQAQLAGWYTIFKNRIEQTYDQTTQLSTYTNLGTVHKYGVDGSVAYKLDNHFSVYTFGSYLWSKIQHDIQGGVCGSTGITTLNGPAAVACTPNTPIYYLTAGKRESTAPVYTLGGRIQGHFGLFEVGVQAKRTGPRYLNDQNTPVYQTYTPTGGTLQFYQVYGAKTPAYTTVDLDARVSLKALVHNDRTYLQFNATNLFDKFYVGAMSTSNATPSNTVVNFVNIGAPRAFSGTFVIGF